MSFTQKDIFFMNEALKEARKAFDKEEVPVGAVVVLNDKIIARAHNEVETLNDATAHAEILALTSAMNFLGSKYLIESVLYITLEPCMMCFGAAYWSKIKRIIFGAYDPKNGFQYFIKPNIWSNIEVLGGLMQEESLKLLKDFFARKRTLKF